MIAWTVIALVLLAFGLGALFGAPYLPTRHQQMKKTLQLLALPAGSLIADLGCGDGRFLLFCARRGYRSIGYEINPVWYLISRWRTRRFRDKITVVWGDAIRREWPADCRGAYIFFVDRHLRRLAAKLRRRNTGVRVVSYAFRIPGETALKSSGGMHLYQF